MSANIFSDLETNVSNVRYLAQEILELLETMNKTQDLEEKQQLREEIDDNLAFLFVSIDRWKRPFICSDNYRQAIERAEHSNINHY